MIAFLLYSALIWVAIYWAIPALVFIIALTFNILKLFVKKT